MQPEMRHKGRMHGVGEDWVAAQLSARGHTVVQQAQVWRNDGVGRFFIDVALAPSAPTKIAVELFTFFETPWLADKEVHRAENLISEGWRVLYIYLRPTEKPTDACIDAVLRYKIDVEAGTKHTYRAVDYNGKLMRLGWLGRDDKLMTDQPEPLPEWEPSWSETPPSPPRVRRLPRSAQWSEGPGRTDPEVIAAENEIRRQWYEYEHAFRAWEGERRRRQAPWEVLPVVTMMQNYDPETGDWSTGRYR